MISLCAWTLSWPRPISSSRSSSTAYIPEEMARQSLDSGELVRINLYEQIPPRQICVVRDMSRSMNAATRKLLELMPSEAAL